MPTVIYRSGHAKSARFAMTQGPRSLPAWTDSSNPNPVPDGLVIGTEPNGARGGPGLLGKPSLR